MSWAAALFPSMVRPAKSPWAIRHSGPRSVTRPAPRPRPIRPARPRPPGILRALRSAYPRSTVGPAGYRGRSPGRRFPMERRRGQRLPTAPAGRREFPTESFRGQGIPAVWGRRRRAAAAVPPEVAADRPCRDRGRGPRGPRNRGRTDPSDRCRGRRNCGRVPTRMVPPGRMPVPPFRHRATRSCRDLIRARQSRSRRWRFRLDRLSPALARPGSVAARCIFDCRAGENEPDGGGGAAPGGPKGGVVPPAEPSGCGVVPGEPGGGGVVPLDDPHGGVVAGPDDGKGGGVVGPDNPIGGGAEPAPNWGGAAGPDGGKGGGVVESPRGNGGGVAAPDDPSGGVAEPPAGSGGGVAGPDDPGSAEPS